MSKGKKKIVAKIKLQVPCGKATPQPPIGPALGQRGVNIMEFCKKFNALSLPFDQSDPIPVQITVFEDKSFEFSTKSPPVPFLIKKFSSIASGSAQPGILSAGHIDSSVIERVVDAKMGDMNSFDRDSCRRMVVGTARSMGIDLKDS